MSRKKEIKAIKDAIAGKPHSNFQVNDRYSAVGRKPPNPATVCEGHCEGMGYYPSKNKMEWPAGAKPDSTGYVFVTCKDCKGTGSRVGADTPRR